MEKFEVIYEFNGSKIWEYVFADNEEHAKKIILERKKYNNVIFLSVEWVNIFSSDDQDAHKTNEKPDLSPYMNPVFRLSDEAYSAWFDRLTGKDENDY